MRTYDVVLVFRPAVTQGAREKFLDNVKKWLGDAKVAKVEDWGKKKLAYPIRKEREGDYVLLSVQSESGVTADFEKRIRMEEGILRHLVLRKN